MCSVIVLFSIANDSESLMSTRLRLTATVGHDFAKSRKKPTITVGEKSCTLWVSEGAMTREW